MTSLRLALLGYGRMGNAIEQIALERGHHITVRASRSNPATLDQLRSADVALDFSNASAVEGHLTLCARGGHTAGARHNRLGYIFAAPCCCQ
ncbi:MAG: hypothetical protein KatS3mg038_0161 [Candidatus Kapaibacterium sp.]|nr:MAG: hypothetical protein KatS3mg038_0161 [Candidatus Kapabacteria bacterium]